MLSKYTFSKLSTSHVLLPSNITFMLGLHPGVYTKSRPSEDRFPNWKILDFLDSWAVVKHLSLDRKLAFTSMLGSDWHTNKQKVYNWPSNKWLATASNSLASTRPSNAVHKSISINSGPRTRTTARPPWFICDRPPTNLWWFAAD